ncbi:MAG: PKD domain-containing protein [Bacteroidetes bacterium]|nr:PKD domain-containing protein [Bacteroidota bacterium]
MRRLILLLAFCLPAILAVAQQPTIFVSGTITYAGTETPVPDHPVNIETFYGNDSINSFVITTITNMQGEYNASLPLGNTTATVHITSPDCNGTVMSATYTVTPNNVFIVHDFSYCGGGGCQAYFTYGPADPASEAIAFYDMSGGEPTSWYWDFGDNSYSEEQYPVHTYSADGTYQVCLTISGADSSCFDTFCQPVVVGNDSTGCFAMFVYSGENNGENTISFFDASFGNHDTYFWVFGDNTVSYEQNPVHTYSQSGIYTVCLAISSANGDCSDEYCMEVFVGQTPGCMASFYYYPDSVPGMYNAYQFVDQSMGNIESWSWDFGDGGGSEEQNPVHMYENPGAYTVCLSIEGPDCESTWCETILIGDSSDCFNYFYYQTVGNSASFEGYHSSNYPATYTWSFGDGTSGSGQQISHTYGGPGTYYVSLMTNDQDCSATSSQIVVIGDSIIFNQVYGQVFEGSFPLEMGMVMLSSISSDPAINPYIDVTMIDSSGVYVFPYVPNGEYVIYAIPLNWNGYIPTYYGDVVNWDEATHIVLGQAQNPYNINLVQFEMPLNPGIGSINGFITESSLRSGMLDKVKMLLYNEDKQVMSFSNVTGNGTFSFGNLANGTYYLYPELSGVPGSYIKVVITDAQTEAEVHLTLTPNGILGIGENNDQISVSAVYPNPASNSVTISLQTNEPAQTTIVVSDISGRAVIQQQIDQAGGNQTITLPVDQLQAGIYFVRVATAGGTSATQRFIKQ